MVQFYDHEYCCHRLPCGVCRLTNTQCPKMFGSITTVTCNPCGDAVPTTSTTTTASTAYGVKGSTWASVNAKEDLK